MKITFQHLCARYGKNEVLHDVSFCVHHGSITALVGRNGVGKTTLLRCLTDHTQPYEGKIILNELSLCRLSLRERARYISCLPQSLPRPHVTVEELVCFGRTPYHSFACNLTDTDRAIVAQVLEDVGICHLKESFVDTLSGGERKKAFFAMTLAQDTPIIVLDEPTAHLDAVSRFEFLSILERMRQKYEKTFLVVMHDLPDLLRCADHIVALHDGSVAFEGEPGAFLQQKIAQRYFGVAITGNSQDGYAVMPIR